ncbi:hypothetical protein N7481_009148 [Penicillium waksmanii]|uniref:uncharacterized protein n=1 Tax=Penicillium waksmanii TaxID=69791 RepID=UPI00254859CC|nr:uncharacterized protein N7481_009148 [Penicillium waksmanii]KAJ5975441.1 hypothetical protein N7481_009148 [Penicillium waksmanii]
MAAQSRALAVPEILTLVLQELDMHTLLVSAQRVSRMWRTVIKETPSLQAKLFLAPISPKDNNPAPIFNPLLATKFPTLIPKTNRTINQPTEFVDLTTIDIALHPLKEFAYLRPEASWRHMLTQQPPAFTLASITRSVNAEGVSLKRSRGPRQDEGLRMGTLFQWVLSLPGHLFAIGVTIFFGGPSPVNTNTPFFNSGGFWADLYQDIVAKHDVILSVDMGSISDISNEDQRYKTSEDAETRNYLYGALQMADLFTSDLSFEEYES